MWEPDGIPLPKLTLGNLAVAEVLFEFDGEFLTFVAADSNNEPLLVHNLCVENQISRYVVSPVDNRILRDLKTGRVDIYTALRQPRCWIADIKFNEDLDPTWEITGLVQVRFESIPSGFLPQPGAMIRPDLDPVFRLRLIGDGVGPGSTTAADVRAAVQASENALRGLARLVLDQPSTAGRANRGIRDLSSNLTYLYTRAASFEIAFGAPKDHSLTALDDQFISEMGQWLNAGLQAVRSRDNSLPMFEKLSSERATQLFEAVRALTPPSRGGVNRVEIGGKVTMNSFESKILTRSDRVRSTELIAFYRQTPIIEKPFRVFGVAEVADKGYDVFVLRQLDADGMALAKANEIEFHFDEYLYDKVSDAWISEQKIAVVGERTGDVYRALDIQEVGATIQRD